MGRKAKDAAQKKIGEWTGAQRNVSKAKARTKTTTHNENANTSDENRTPLQTQSQSDINAMKNCSVRLEIMQTEPKTTKLVKKTPVKKVPAADVNTKDKQTNEKNVYDDFSFEADEMPLHTVNENAMKELIDKLAKENKIEVKKYRSKIVKTKKTVEKVAAKKTAVTQKRRREKQPIDVEPPQKKPNLKSKVVDAGVQKDGTSSSNAVTKISKQNVELAKMVNNNHLTEAAVAVEPKQTATTKTAITADHVGAQSRQLIRNRILNNFQSTPKSSSVLGPKAIAKSKENQQSLNSLFFENLSPLAGPIKGTRGNVMRQRLQLSAINDNSQEEASTSTAHNDVEKSAQPQPIDFNDDDFDFGNNAANEPQPEFDLDVDKENSLHRHTPGTSAQVLSPKKRSQTTSTVTSSVMSKPSTSAAASTSWDEPSTSAAALAPTKRPQTAITVTSSILIKPGTSTPASTSRDKSTTSSAGNTTPRNANDQSVFAIQDTSDYHIFSPTKRRVYGRSPLKNITSEVNNTDSPSFESLKSIATVPRSFGSLAKSTLNSIQFNNTSKGDDITLPEGSYFSSRRAADDFDRSIDNQNFIDDCFGFDTGDDDEIDNNNDTMVDSSECAKTKQTNDSQLETEKGLKEIRANLKRFLQNPDGTGNVMKQAKLAHQDKAKKKKVKSPVKVAFKSPIKNPARSPIKSPIKKNAVFGDTGAKQKDIRNAFTAKSSDNAKSKPATLEDGPIALFGEIETVQDRRRSYSRPQRQRKRRISIDSEHSEDEEEEEHSDDESFDADGKSKKRAKRRKKTATVNPKELEELEEFARKTNAHFEEVDSFSMVIE